MNYRKEKYILLFLFQICRLHALCPSDPSLVCCPDKVWDDQRGKCIDCIIGYSGINCSTPCRHPSYGKDCQSQCNCGTKEFCSPSHGCIPNSTEVERTETSLATTPKEPQTSTTTTTSLYTTRITSSQVVTTSAAISENTRSTHEVTAIPQARTSPKDLFMSNSPLVVGIFVFCGLFLVLFAVLVITQIRYKCFKNNGTPHNQDICTNGNAKLRSYEVILEKNPQDLNSGNRVETPPEQRDPQYADIENYLENEQKMTNNGVPKPCQSNSDNSAQREGPTLDKTIPKYIEIVGSPEHDATRHELSNELAVVSNTYILSDCTNPKQLYLSVV